MPKTCSGYESVIREGVHVDIFVEVNWSFHDSPDRCRGWECDGVVAWTVPPAQLATLDLEDEEYDTFRNKYAP